MTKRPQVLMISKPITAPWNDSAKNIVRDQVMHRSSYTYRLMTTRGDTLTGDGIITEPLYPDAGRYRAGIKQNLKIMFRGLRPGPVSLYHYFFAPNLLTSLAGRAQRIVAGVKSVQTICSAPATFNGIKKLIFTDGIIVLSNDTKNKMERFGVPANKIRLIRPGIEPLRPPDDNAASAIRRKLGLDDGRIVVFPGDLEFSNAAQTVAAAAREITSIGNDVQLVFACRIKTEAAREIQAKIKKQLAYLKNRVHFINEVDDMPAFVGTADLVVLPADNLYAKMDVPLVLLEAMSQEVPVVIADAAPLNELLETGGILAVPPGDSDRLGGAVSDILTNKNMHLSLAKAGAQAVKDNFSAKNMARQIENFYDELLADR